MSVQASVKMTALGEKAGVILAARIGRVNSKKNVRWKLSGNNAGLLWFVIARKAKTDRRSLKAREDTNASVARSALVLGHIAPMPIRIKVAIFEKPLAKTLEVASRGAADTGFSKNKNVRKIRGFDGPLERTRFPAGRKAVDIPESVGDRSPLIGEGGQRGRGMTPDIRATVRQDGAGCLRKAHNMFNLKEKVSQSGLSGSKAAWKRSGILFEALTQKAEASRREAVSELTLRAD